MNEFLEKIKNKKTDCYYDFVFTNDGSVGLYNYDVDDIYHSIFGAKTEGWEKFVKPLNFEKIFFNKKRLKVLDICYGIGYNTKALLKKIIQTGYMGNVDIDILEYDKNLVLISPFIRDGYFNDYPSVSLILFGQLMSHFDKHFIESFLDKNKKYVEPFYRRYIQQKTVFKDINNPSRLFRFFVHNIYYHCISLRIKRQLKRFKFNKFSIKPYFDDARKSIKHLSDKYDIIFLDAFTPSKLPTLWTLDFFKELKSHSHDSTILLTYSNSISVRHAMVDAGFFVGKIFDKKNRPCGTIASTNKSYINIPLNDYDIGLMNTTGGIYFRDNNLENTAESIIDNYNNRKVQSNLQSTSSYIKHNKNIKEISDV